ncbi:hypothetical protein XELAEV_18046965mg [Xenopus laevis]|uniref:Protein kinase domain-containing protein n=1 Tax=Xenopus laevis TaxID=8355 RepID=A0A974BUB5_XENLA|nr:hypothetical protein XELAEV_18046965mg [Xenopus laevis]
MVYCIVFIPLVPKQSPLEVIEYMTLNNFYILQIVLEYCGGGSLYNLISKTNGQSLKETWIGYVCEEVLKGLHHIDKNRAVHRDIKSLNIMLTETAKVKILDFGNSWDLDPQTGLCHEADGTPHWMAHEAIRQKGQRLAYDTKCDIWSLGITTIEMAEGKQLWLLYFIH